MSPERKGLFIAVVGPSGAGKDTLLARAADQLRDCHNISFARRIITRPSDGLTEDHDSLDTPSFLAAENCGEFCLSWEAHGLFYGLPKSISEDVAAGHVVVANMSRRALETAARLFGAIDLIEITARPELLLKRLAARGRETPDEISNRVKRRAALAIPENTTEYLQIDNSGDVSVAVDELSQHLRSRAAIVALTKQAPFSLRCGSMTPGPI